MIRNAEDRDIKKLLDMTQDFYFHTNYQSHGLNYRMEDMRKTLRMLIRAENTILLVSVENGELTGVLAAIASPWIADISQWMFSEIFWWIEKSARGNGLHKEFIAAFENEAREFGACHISMGTIPKYDKSLSRMYKGLGFTYRESYFVKEVI